MRKVREAWKWLNCMHIDTREGGAVMPRCGFRSVRYLEVKLKIRCKNALGPRTVRCSEFRGGRFSEVANVLQVWDFQSVTKTLSALGSVSASRSVRSGRFYCNIALVSRHACSTLITKSASMVLRDANMASYVCI